MSAIPGGLETDQQPPMTVPLRHFVVALGFLLAGVAVGAGLAADAVPGLGRLVHIHLLLAGWVCVTIMGAMTQFVPVWSGVTLHSQRLASLQLALVTAGLTGFALALGLAALPWLAVFGVVMLAGFWVFVYNIGRTLAAVDSYDVTEQHFLLALGFFLVLTLLGLVVALDLSQAVLASTPVTHDALVGAHATLAVFGAVLTTIYGALYQLGTMFTQTELHDVDHHLQSVETVAHPTGVVVLAGGRLVGLSPISAVGGVLVSVAALAVAAVIGRKLVEMQVEWTPMHSRYVVVVLALAAWGLAALPAWVSGPTGREALFGPPAAGHLLTLGVVGFVVLGTLYHIVPFIVWVHRYSDLLGFQDVPMIDDLYSDSLAVADFSLLVTGTTALVASEFVAGTWLVAIGGALVAFGVLVFVTNMLLVVRAHSPTPLDKILFGSLSPRSTGDTDAVNAPTDAENDQRIE